MGGTDVCICYQHSHIVVHGHAGKLLFGFLKSTQSPIVLMMGRAQLAHSYNVHQSLHSFFWIHSYYEGHSIQSITLPIRILKRLGVDILIGITVYTFAVNLIYVVNRGLVTNAAGGLNAEYAIGDIVVLNDVRVFYNSAT